MASTAPTAPDAAHTVVARFKRVVRPAGNDGATVDVEVGLTADGYFRVVYDGEDYEAESLDQLLRQLRETMVASRHEIPFRTMEGSKGVIRGLHGGHRHLLVTWEGGAKGQIDTYTRVFRDGELSDEDAAELERLRDEIARLRTRQEEISGRAKVRAETLLVEALGVESIRDIREAT